MPEPRETNNDGRKTLTIRSGGSTLEIRAERGKDYLLFLQNPEGESVYATFPGEGHGGNEKAREQLTKVYKALREAQQPQQ